MSHVCSLPSGPVLHQQPQWAARLCVISKPSPPLLWPAFLHMLFPLPGKFSPILALGWFPLSSYTILCLVSSYSFNFILNDALPEKPFLTTYLRLMPPALLLSFYPFHLIRLITIWNSLSFTILLLSHENICLWGQSPGLSAHHCVPSTQRRVGAQKNNHLKNGFYTIYKEELSLKGILVYQSTHQRGCLTQTVVRTF